MSVENTKAININHLTKAVKTWISHRFSWLAIGAFALALNTAFNYQIIDIESKPLDIFKFYCNVILALIFTYSVYLKSKRITDLYFSKLTWYFLIALALLLRLLLAKLGGNYDLESFEITGDIILNGDSVYEHTNRYNYGPIWAYCLGFLKYLSSIGGGFNKTLFHAYIVCTLFLFELLLLKALLKNGFDQLMCLIFLFNPISLILIGHHSQFDIIAISIAYWAYLFIKNKQLFWGIFLLGLSYSIKHIFVFLPLILLFDKSINFKNRCLISVLPAGLFAWSFLPFYYDWQAIKTNVLSYQLNHGQTLFYKLFEIAIPHAFSDFESLKTIPLMTGYKPIWILSFLCLGYLINKNNKHGQFEMYLTYLVGSSLAISEQYLLIPIIMVIAMRRYFISWIYVLLATYYIMFVSAHNTAQYFNLTHLGINLDKTWYSIGFAQIQICLLLILYIAFKKNSNLKLTE